MEARVHRLSASSPDDVSSLRRSVEAGLIDPKRIVAILGKTEGNGCVNDFTRGFASNAFKVALASYTGMSPSEVERQVALIMSGGTEGGLSPHWLIFEIVPGDGVPARSKALAIGTAMTRRFTPAEIGRAAQIDETAAAVRAAMSQAQIRDTQDVHYVQVKCPLLTKARIAEAARSGQATITDDTLKSMAYSRGASALGVAVGLGEHDRASIDDDMVCSRFDLFSGRASTSAGVELLENQVLVVGNSSAWSGDLTIGHDVMQDAIDVGALARTLTSVGIQPAIPVDASELDRVFAVLAKAEPSRTGLIRGDRHTMLDDSDISATRHARALVGGVLAGILGITALFVSGGAEHQGPDGGGPVAVIARRPPPNAVGGKSS